MSSDNIETQQDSYWYEYYTLAYDRGDIIAPIWAKAMALHDGDESKAKYEYIRLCVDRWRSGLDGAEDPPQASTINADIEAAISVQRASGKSTNPNSSEQIETAGNSSSSERQDMFQPWYGWLIAYAPCLLGGVFSVLRTEPDSDMSVLIAGAFGGSLVGIILGLMLGGIFVLFRKSAEDKSTYFKKWIFVAGLVSGILVLYAS